MFLLLCRNHSLNATYSHNQPTEKLVLIKRLIKIQNRCSRDLQCTGLGIDRHETISVTVKHNNVMYDKKK